MERWRFSATVLLPAVLVLVLTGAAVTAFVLWSIADLDQRAEARQTSIVSQILENKRTGLSHEQHSIALSDDAFRHIRLAYDPNWVAERVGHWMHAFFGHSHTIILNENDQPLYVTTDGLDAPAGTFEAGINPSLAPLLRQLRQMIAGGAIERYWHDQNAGPPTISEFALVRGHPAILAVTPILGESRALAGPPGSEYVLASIVYLDAALATEISRQYLVADAAFVLRPSGGNDHAIRPIANSQGRFVAFFQWTKDRPGQLMLAGTGPALAAGFVVAAVLVFLLMEQLRRSSAAVEISRRHAEYQAAHDRLTGLPNRGSFDGHLTAKLLARELAGARIDLLMLDLDRFKQVNDTLGHQAGDELICRVAERICEILGPDVFVARIGGDEFAMILVSQGNEFDALDQSEKLIEAIGRPYAIRQFQAHVGASIGIVTAIAGECEPREAVRKADIALYEAKAAGRNRAMIYEEHMNELLQLQHTIEAELRDALANGGQLSVAFQPLIDQSSRRVIGAEALARWHHPKYGQISPARFIPIAEATGLIEQLGEYVLRRACTLGAAAPGFTLAVNISPTQLRNPAFATLVFDILHETGMRAEDLELEITESILLDDEHVSAQNLLTFRSAGIHIALDDFGTGYSSLSYLKRYPVDRIKIDRSFVSQLAPGHVSVAITRALVTLAHAMNIHVTAEGVETEDQAHILGELGCNILQGFLFAPAMDGDAIRAVFAEPDRLPQQPRRSAHVA